jgi:histidinol-phosphate/aromatic aminotransferase/cobyric acid decarboxylase-like protein
MSQSRRGFIRSIGLGTAGLIGSSFIIGRGREAAAFEPAGSTLLLGDDVLKISSNENARGPGPNVMRAIQEAVTPRLGRGYPPDYTADLVDTVAEYNGVARDNVVIGTGSGGLLVAATRAFCKDGRALVTAAPTYATTESTARSMGVEVHAPPLDRSLALDLDAMASAASGAGLVFLCNPNNPTGTAHPAGAVEAFVRQVKARSPDTAILLDEAYMDYAVDPGVESGVALTQEFPGVFITRTLSKAHGMAGLRVGYGSGSAGHHAGADRGVEPGEHEHPLGGGGDRLPEGHRPPGLGAAGEQADPGLRHGRFPGHGLRRAGHQCQLRLRGAGPSSLMVPGRVP